MVAVVVMVVVVVVLLVVVEWGEDGDVSVVSWQLANSPRLLQIAGFLSLSLSLYSQNTSPCGPHDLDILPEELSHFSLLHLLDANVFSCQSRSKTKATYCPLLI